MKCKRCRKPLVSEYFLVADEFLCIDCFIPCKYIVPNKIRLRHKAIKLCTFKGCTQPRKDATYFKLCKMHYKECTYSACKRCRKREVTENGICTGCMNVEFHAEYRAYRSLGDPEELKRELEDYRSLGSYNRLADLVSRAEIMDHCDELDIK